MSTALQAVVLVYAACLVVVILYTRGRVEQHRRNYEHRAEALAKLHADILGAELDSLTRDRERAQREGTE